MNEPRRPSPPQPEQQQQPPGETTLMMPVPDHGEDSYQGNGKLAGKVALITGADSGIGKAVAIAFAREGADAVISYLNEDDDARDTAKWVEDAGRKALVIPETSNPRITASTWWNGRWQNLAVSISS